MIKNQTLLEIAVRERAATPGPWYWHPRWALVTDEGKQDGQTILEVAPTGGLAIWNGGLHGPDAQFIAHARTDIPLLLAERTTLLEALRRIADAPCEHSVSKKNEDAIGWDISWCKDRWQDPEKWCASCVARDCLQGTR